MLLFATQGVLEIEALSVSFASQLTVVTISRGFYPYLFADFTIVHDNLGQSKEKVKK